ncbi:methylated-DNA--[protein]-cysteine S-methyltransferase [Microbacterium sp. LWS13-1.2]|uniref:Methylated-DNA--[protein]-cysteine S-methyltransferase n=1 Tax=Microbacterium sp. LWS13-1.2 TaxID=3135264 RepID=A0AAU6S9G7_9MICO
MTPEEPPRFRVHPSPIGDILIVTTADGIVTLHPFDGPLRTEIERVALQLRAVPVPDEGTDASSPSSRRTRAADSVFDVAIAQLDEYFEGERRGFELPLDWRLVRGFTHAALEAVCDIPYGETASYGEVAVMAGTARAARAVGTACATTPFSIVVPVHRVVRADGSLGEYGGRPDLKRFLIELEQGPGIPPAPSGAHATDAEAASDAPSGADATGAGAPAAPVGAKPAAGV